MDEATLPRLNACLDLYQSAYDQHGTEPFTPVELNWDAPGTEREHVLELAVAYGLLSLDDTAYQVTCAPGAADECWDTAIEERVSRVKQGVQSRLDATAAGRESDPEPTGLTYDGEEYVSVPVEESDEFGAIIDAVDSLELAEWDGIVIRSPGDYANEVQRYADRLEDPSSDEVPFSTRFRKEYSNVSGTSKDELEYRVFLSTS